MKTLFSAIALAFLTLANMGCGDDDKKTKKTDSKKKPAPTATEPKLKGVTTASDVIELLAGKKIMEDCTGPDADGDYLKGTIEFSKRDDKTLHQKAEGVYYRDNECTVESNYDLDSAFAIEIETVLDNNRYQVFVQDLVEENYVEYGLLSFDGKTLCYGEYTADLDGSTPEKRPIAIDDESCRIVQ